MAGYINGLVKKREHLQEVVVFRIIFWGFPVGFFFP